MAAFAVLADYISRKRRNSSLWRYVRKPAVAVWRSDAFLNAMQPPSILAWHPSVAGALWFT